MPTINTNDAKELKSIFEECKTIAIVGLSPDNTKASHQVALYLQQHGFKIFPIYPKGDYILGEKVYRNILEIEEKIDMVDMFRKPEIADTLVKECIGRGDVKVFWLQLGIVNNNACEIAKKHGIKPVQNRCTKIEYERAVRP